MNNVITEEQARKITGGRKPLMPVEYETAINALAACITIDETKYWSDKADALAAWAKIYRSPDAERKAKQLKLHAYRRMGQLAEQLRPRKGRREGTSGSHPGPVSILVENGLTPDTAQVARRMAKLPEKDFSAATELPRPPSPSSLTRRMWSSEWTIIAQALRRARAEMTRCTPSQAAQSVSADFVPHARLIARQTIEWLDEFERRLPKA
jgi:hypothetical protein